MLGLLLYIYHFNKTSRQRTAGAFNNQSMPFEILNFLFMFFSSLQSKKGAEVAAFVCGRIFFTGI